MKDFIKLTKKLFKRKKFLLATVILFLSLFLFLASSQIPQEIRQRAQTNQEEDMPEDEDEGAPEGTEEPEPPLCEAKEGFCTPVSEGCFAGDAEYKAEKDYGQLDCAQGSICCGTAEEPTAAAPTPTTAIASTATTIPTSTPTKIPTSTPTMAPLVGDVNGDNILSALDYNAIVECYDRTPPTITCHPSKKQSTDLNQDGTINGIDINLFLRAAKK